MQCIIFLDTEGLPIQELAALEMNIITCEIVDSYHDFAHEYTDDSFARKHVHGLNPKHFSKKGFPLEADLLNDFRKWLESKRYTRIFAHAPGTERKAFNNELIITNLDLPMWTVRRYEPYHVMAKSFKDNMVALAGKRCSKKAHSFYEVPPYGKGSLESYQAKLEHEFHCALYDAYELYLAYLY